MIRRNNNMKGFKENIHKLTKQASTMNSVVSEWSTHFPDAFSKFQIQKDAVDNVERERNLATDNKIKEALTAQAGKRKINVVTTITGRLGMEEGGQHSAVGN
jgi:hypothetical protein